MAAAFGEPSAQPNVWQPSAGNTQMLIWPSAVPDAETAPGPESVETDPTGASGGPITWVTNVGQPTMTVYLPHEESNTGAAVVVLPGGGFEGLAIDLEGTDVCDLLTRKGITCVLLKYRVPSIPFDWHCKCRPDSLAIPTPALEDVQRTIGLVRSRAAKWHVDPQKIGVIGFSAGGYLVAEISTHFERRLFMKLNPQPEATRHPASRR